MGHRTIALSGELGSGKSSVARRVAEALDARVVSTGEAQRRIAAARGLSTLELNRLSESDPTVDEEIDAVFRSLSAIEDPLVVDSRLAWHFLPDAYAVHLVVDPSEGARRALDRPAAATEHYGSLDEAETKIEARVQSEHLRFTTYYGIDIFRLRNYDLVVDTTVADADHVAGVVLGAFEEAGTGPRRSGNVALHLAPGRVAPTEADGPLTVRYERPRFLAVTGRVALRAAIEQEAPLIAATLVPTQSESSG